MTEAHPIEGWTSPEVIKISQARTLEMRQAAVETLVAKFKPKAEVVCDAMDNKVLTTYKCFPNRIVILNADGTYAFIQRNGPFSYDPLEAIDYVKKHSSA